MYSSEPFLARWGKRTPVSCSYQTIALLDLIYFTKTATSSSTTQSRTSSHCQGTTPITKSSEAELSGNAKDVGHYTPTPTLGLAHHTLCLCLAPCGWCTWIVSWSTIDQRGHRPNPCTTTTRGYSNNNLCYYRLKKVLLAILVTHFLCVPIGRVTIELSIGTHLFIYCNFCLVLP